MTKLQVLNSCFDCMWLRRGRDPFEGPYCMYLHRFIEVQHQWFPSDCPHPNSGAPE